LTLQFECSISPKKVQQLKKKKRPGQHGLKCVHSVRISSKRRVNHQTKIKTERPRKVQEKKRRKDKDNSIDGRKTKKKGPEKKRAKVLLLLVLEALRFNFTTANIITIAFSLSN